MTNQIKTDNLRTFTEIIDALNPEINPERILVDKDRVVCGITPTFFGNRWSQYAPYRLPTPAERAKYLLEKGHVIEFGGQYRIHSSGDLFCVRNTGNGPNWVSAPQTIGELLSDIEECHKRYQLKDLGPYVEPKPERVLTPDNFEAEITKLESVELWQGGCGSITYSQKRPSINTHRARQAIHYVVHHGKELGQELRNYVWKEGE